VIHQGLNNSERSAATWSGNAPSWSREHFKASVDQILNDLHDSICTQHYVVAQHEVADHQYYWELQST
jgi:hypothetical protein